MCNNNSMRGLISILFILFFKNVFCQNSEGRFIKDRRTGCMIWSEYYSPKDSITWSGKCKNNYAHGKGVLLWYDNNKVAASYIGQMKAGKPNGRGKYDIRNYGILKGIFKDGMLNGKGAINFSNGGRLIGNFTQGEFLNLDSKYLSLLRKNYLDIKDTSEIYVNDNDSDKLFYYTLLPKGEIRAVLVLFPSTGETLENAISCNKELIQQSYNNNILSVFLSSNHNKSLEMDAFAMRFFDTVFLELVTKHNAPKDKFILSGFSLGGENALQYTEMSRNKNYQTYLKPLAVIGVDPPVDMVDFYYSVKKQIFVYEREGKFLSESKRIALEENQFLIDYFHTLYGGSPEEFPEKYIQGSSFSRNLSDGGNAKYLIDVPVRLYCDPDIIWQLKNKGRDFYSMNATNLSAMINFLMQKGNKQAELVSALGKGFRVDGVRHPHSWSIVDPNDCIHWILTLIE